MPKRLRIVGIVLLVIGLVLLALGGVAYARVQDGYRTLQAFSVAQNVALSYDDQGRLTDRGTPEGAQAIMTLLTEDWAYPVVESDLDPADPVVNTATEYMYQMAAIAYHTLNSTQTVVLPEDVEYEGVPYKAGPYEFEVDGRYWTDFDRAHPIEGLAREQAWSGTAHGLIAELGVGTVTHSTLQLGVALAALYAVVGLTAIVGGLGLIWVAAAKRIPDTIPTSMLIEPVKTT